MNRVVHIHPSPEPGKYKQGNSYEYVPAYNIINVYGKLSAMRVRKEAGVRITLPCGTKIYRTNSFYSHIEGMKPKDTDIF